MMKFRGTFSPFELARDLVSPTPEGLPQRLSVCSKLIHFSSFNPKRTIQPSILTNREKAWKNNMAEMQNSIVQFNRTQKSRCYKKCFYIYLACFNFHLISFNRVDHGVRWLKKSWTMHFEFKIHLQIVLPQIKKKESFYHSCQSESKAKRNTVN